MSLYLDLKKNLGWRPNPISRREMLQKTLGVGAAMLLSGIGCSSSTTTTPNTPTVPTVGGKKRRITVIGAGFAGMAAAFELQSVGYEVTVLEARNRVGGRILSFSDFVTGKNVEGGGELIGSNHPVWMAYKEKFKLEMLDVTDYEEGTKPFLVKGKLLSKEEQEKLEKEMEVAIHKMNEDAAKVDAYEPWKSPNASALDRRSTAAFIESLECSAFCKEALTLQFQGDNGVKTELQSYLGNLAQIKGGGVEKYWEDSEVYRCKGGNQQLAFKLLEKVGEKNVKLGTVVSAVNASGAGMTVTLADGSKVESNDVVLTVPPSVWKNIKFDPEFPAALMPQMGVNVKFLVATQEAFWKASKLKPDSQSDGAISETWEGTDNQGDAKGFALNCFSGGPAAETCRAWRKEERDSAYLAELEKLYPDVRKHFQKSRFMDWPSEPFTGGGYSFPKPGELTLSGPILKKGIGNLHFAGEHACHAFVGYMEGALSSGVDVARRIAARDGVAVSN